MSALLDYDDTAGFCTLLGITASSLFARGYSASSEAMGPGSLDFSVCVPEVGSQKHRECRGLFELTGIAPRWRLSTMAPVIIEVPRTNDLSGWPHDRQARHVSELVNHFLLAYEHTYLDTDLPRHRLDGRPILQLALEGSIELKYVPIELNLREVLDHYLPSHGDIEPLNVSILMAEPKQISPAWRIVIDGVRHFENGHVRESILCACSAAEFVASPAVDEWLRHFTLERDNDGVTNAVREMGNPLRFDLCISTIYKRAFSGFTVKQKQELLTGLRSMNNLRNRVVHAGVVPEPKAAAEALHHASLFVCQIWLDGLNGGEESA